MSDVTRMTRRGFLAAGVLALAACAQSQDEPQTEPETTDAPTDEGADVVGSQPVDDEAQAEAETAEGSKILVAYYSRADENYANGGKEWLEVGHTKVMAGYIAEALGADTYEIVPVEPYPEGYDDCCDVAKQEQADDARPAIANALPDVAGYDTIFLGCPIWWGDEPMIVRTFVEGVDLSGKTVVPFTTHGGSGLDRVPANLQAAIPGARFLDGHAVAGTSVDGARAEVMDWAKGLASA
jgi:flavodoxin